MKFVHDLQPLGYRKQQMDPLLPKALTQCPCCRQALETQLHMLQCTHNPLRKKSLIKFYKDCASNDGNRFPQIFADLVGQWLLCDTNIPTFEKSRDTFLRHDIIPVEFSALVRLAITDQTMIGWIHATRGLLAKKWMELASMSYDKLGTITKCNDGNTRLRQVIKALHSLTTEIWVGRNSALHESGREVGPLSLIDAEIVRYHREPERLLTDDSHYCEQSLNRILASSASIKRRWLHRVKRSCERKAKFDRDQPRITKYFNKDDRQQKHYQHHKGRPPEATIQQSAQSNSRTTTVQRLIAYFLHERASNTPNHSTSYPSPPPPPVSNK